MRELSEHYAEDSLKLEAALFLYENSRSGYSYYGREYEEFTKTISRNVENSEVQAKELKKLQSGLGNLKLHSDSSSLNSEFIIEWVDKSFEIWQQVPWHEKISFDIFCKYILPIKIDYESIENWKELAYVEMPDSIKNIDDMEKACYAMATIVNEPFSDFKLLFGNNALGLPALPYSALKDLRVGSCDNISRVGIYSLRAQGFPVTMDFTPHWANRSPTGHTWCTLVIDENECIPFNFPLDKWRKYLGSYKWRDRLESKVYRMTFDIDSGTYRMAIEDPNFKNMPGYISDPHIRDITDQYVDVASVSVPFILDVPENKEKAGYISVFSRENWVPVGWGSISGDSAVFFEKIVQNSVYLPVLFGEGITRSINYPFVYTDSLLTFFKPDFNKSQSINLTRKYPLFVNIRQFIEQMTNGRFQGANKEDFSDAVDIYTIKENPGTYYNEIKINHRGKFKYYRYIGDEYSWSNIGEVEFYGGEKGNQLMVGETIGFEGSGSGRGPEAAFDGDPVTFYESKYQKVGWVGMAFKEGFTLKKIRFIARTDYNIIVPGDNYELLYWDKEWRSLGVKTADSNILTYEDTPKNALFWLRNLDHGVEERIFSIGEDGQQIWW